MRYLVVVEINRTGYISGLYYTIEEALIVFENITIVADRFHYQKNIDDSITFSYFKSYTIRNELYINKPGSYIITDGIISIYVFDVEKHWKNIENFVKEREFQTDLFIDS